jgi:predicted nucleic acid-binding protein
VAEQQVVVVDTDIFSSIYIDPDGAGRRGLPVASWISALAGLRVLISFQTRAEVLAGIRGSNWGNSRVVAGVAKLDTAPTIPADHEVIDAFADLTVSCRRAGHGLQNPVHAADRWVAACAIAKGLALFGRDGIYTGAPGLRLLDRGGNV